MKKIWQALLGLFSPAQPEGIPLYDEHIISIDIEDWAMRPFDLKQSSDYIAIYAAHRETGLQMPMAYIHGQFHDCHAVVLQVTEKSVIIDTMYH